jgi:hypothetical protein
MVISERHVKIQIFEIVSGCRGYIFHPKEHEDLPKKFSDAEAELKGIGRLFPDGKIARYLKVYSEELAHLRMLTGV